MHASKIASVALLGCAAFSPSAWTAPTVTSITDLGRLSTDSSEKT